MAIVRSKQIETVMSIGVITAIPWQTTFVARSLSSGNQSG